MSLSFILTGNCLHARAQSTAAGVSLKRGCLRLLTFTRLKLYFGPQVTTQQQAHLPVYQDDALTFLPHKQLFFTSISRILPIASFTHDRLAAHVLPLIRLERFYRFIFDIDGSFVLWPEC